MITNIKINRGKKMKTKYCSKDGTAKTETGSCPKCAEIKTFKDNKKKVKTEETTKIKTLQESIKTLKESLKTAKADLKVSRQKIKDSRVLNYSVVVEK
jgi:molecular chaperone GrpE (heat shock protein)